MQLFLLSKNGVGNNVLNYCMDSFITICLIYTDYKAMIIIGVK